MSPQFYDDAFPITPDDSNNLARIPTAILVGGAGTLKVLTQGGSTVSLNSIAAGTILPLRVKKVFASGTSATNLNGLLAKI